jgi:hypothetical protein
MATPVAGVKKPRLLWLGDEESATTESLASKIVVENTWCLEHVHKSPENLLVSFKAGSKDYALKRYIETNAMGKPETRLSESYLKKLYSELWPIRKHFFFIRVDDRRKQHRPVYQTVMDIPTALAFFETNPASTITIVGRMVAAIVTRWNSTWSKNPEVSVTLTSDLKCLHYYISATSINNCLIFFAFSRNGRPECPCSYTRSWLRIQRL